MASRLVVVVVAVFVIIPSGPAGAEVCGLDPVPGATLLLPYFEVDIGDATGQGVNTVFTITNTEPNPTVVHVTLWTDWAFATLDFDVFLTGHDTVTVDLFQVFVAGNLPVTADEQSDPDDTISPNGGNPSWDGSFTFCANVFPFPEPVITGGLRDRLQNAHSGYPVPTLGDNCAGEAFNGDGSCSEGICPSGTIARGFVTVDSANDCNLLFPFDNGYFVDGGTGAASNTNNLSGEFTFREGGEITAGGPLVAVEADDFFTTSSTPTGYTFYGRFTQGDGGSDNREPLGTTWSAQFADGDDSGTDFVVWRDPTSDETPVSGWTCGLAGAGAGPDWAPLSESQVVCIDEESNVAEALCAGKAEGSACFPLATQKVAVGAGSLSPSFESGWCYLNLNLDDSFSDDVDFPPPGGTIAQSYVFTVYRSTTQVAAATAGFVLADACEDVDQEMEFEAQVLFADDFELGNTSRWSNVVP